MEKKIQCLIWPELNDYTGKTRTIAKFENERGTDLKDFLNTVNSFWNDLKKIILTTTETTSKISCNLDAWFTFEFKELTSEEIKTMLEDVETEGKKKYNLKTFLLKNDETDNFSWKKFTNYVNKSLIEKYKKTNDIESATSAVLDAFFGPLCDTFRQDETGNVPIEKILPTKQMVANLFKDAIKFLNSTTACDHIEQRFAKTAIEIIEEYEKIPTVSVVEIKE